MNTYLAVLKKYKDFSGRARRSEYWVFSLISGVIAFVLSIIDMAILGTDYVGFGILSFIYSLAVLLPALAVSVRRLHDTGRSGWWWFIILIPFVGAIVSLSFCYR